VYLEHCPDCGTELSRSNEVCSHTVEDLPAFEEAKTQVTRYEKERQWCGICKKKVTAEPAGVIPRCRLGVNLLLYVLSQKYGAKISWETIVFNLQVLYGVTVSEGALVAMVHRVRQSLGERYLALLEEIRGSPVKHADETAWRVNGINHWLWGFFTPTVAYYTIAESRGKGIPSAILVGSHDQLTPLSCSETMRGRISGSEMHIIPDAGHFPSVENPAVFNERLLSFLKRL